MKCIVQLDLDLKYKTNFRDLFQQFKHFSPEAVIGIVREMQPVYRYLSLSHTLTLTHIHTKHTLLACVLQCPYSGKYKTSVVLTFLCLYSKKNSWSADLWPASVTPLKLGQVKSQNECSPFQNGFSPPPSTNIAHGVAVKRAFSVFFPWATVTQATATVTGDKQRKFFWRGGHGVSLNFIEHKNMPF